MRGSEKMTVSYDKKVEMTLEYIEKHLYENLTVRQLSNVACLSHYHFHRIFTAMVGMPISQYIRLLRLKRSAKQIVHDKSISILNIALDAGFDSHEAFSRAFKKQCGVTPNAFRKNPVWSSWEFKPKVQLNMRLEEMKITIEKRSPVRVAVCEHRGDHMRAGETAGKLIGWAKSRNYPVYDGGGYCIAYNDPDTTNKEDFRADFCLDVENCQIDGEGIQEKTISGGRYAVYRLYGSHEKIRDAVMAIYKEWLPQSGEELRDMPLIFQYHNYEMNVAPADLITDICVPIK